MESFTPAMKQYMEIKSRHRDCIVFFRMGDFYETFYDDAKITSKVLDIALTKRGIKKSEKVIPLAGIPYHAADSYLSKMIKAGYKIAVVEQLEDPKFTKGVVKRGVVKIITPGTAIGQNMLGTANNFIAAVLPEEKTGVAIIDLSTGEFLAFEKESFDEAVDELIKHMPSEVLLPSSAKDRIGVMMKEKGFYVTYVEEALFFPENAKDTLMSHFGVVSLEGFGLRGKDTAVSASGALLSYLSETQKTSLSHISRIRYSSADDFLQIDATTMVNLGIFGNGKNSLSLYDVLNKTVTAMGSRLLRKWLLKPLVQLSMINERLLAVEELTSNYTLLDEARGLMKNIADIERIISRVSMGSCNPRDFVHLRNSLLVLPDIKNLLSESESSLLSRISRIEDMSSLSLLIENSIRDEPPVSTAEGGFIKEGYNEELDRLRGISANARSMILQMEERERNSTGIKSLKIRYNKIFGYYIDITKPNLTLVPERYLKRQTLVNSERFTTEELRKLEEEILSAEEKSIALEQRLYAELVEKVKKYTNNIQAIAESIACLDAVCSFAVCSLHYRYKKPIVNEGYKLKLIKCRHPVVERVSDFVSNDCIMSDENRLMIITGPNMAGKSVYMRQVALCVIMAQIGCFVPAEEVLVGIVDKVFCRSGAGDDITRGQSTFMAEMLETAQILNSATPNSLIVLDEIGRGTSTYDGVAIAWSVAEHIAKKIRAKTLFATHYHVLNSLAGKISGVKNYNIAVEEREDKIIFLRKILSGGTDKSYGIHVAKLAGMPPEVIERSKQLQFQLERDDEISEKIVIETRKRKEKDKLRKDIEEVSRLIKSRQVKLTEI